jgi:hypothetical protein
MKTTTAYCYRNGAIRFRCRPGKGSLTIATGEAKRLRELIGGSARHAYDGKTLLVPGIPEAENDTQACDALIAYSRQIRARLKGERQ